MQPTNSTPDIVTIILFTFAGVILASVVLGAWVLYRVKRVTLPANADFWETLRVTPLSVVILLDLLDFGLDFLSAPVAWVLLTRLGLGPLRWVAAIEGILPFTHLLPTMTLAWLLARLNVFK